MNLDLGLLSSDFRLKTLPLYHDYQNGNICLQQHPDFGFAGTNYARICIYWSL